jgi:nucleoside-diphosphate-sugar epimerase
LDNAKIRSIGFVPHYTIEDAIHRTIDILKGE